MCVCVSMCVCVYQDQAIKGRKKDRHSGGEKSSSASLMETWHELNMRPSLFFLSFEGAVSITTTSIFLPLTPVPLKYLRTARWGWEGGLVAGILMEKLRKAFKARNMCVFG